ALQTNDTDKNYFYFFAKLRDKRSYLDEGNYDRAFKERGVYIDIFPFDKVRLWTHLLGEPLQGHTFKIFRTAKPGCVPNRAFRQRRPGKSEAYRQEKASAVNRSQLN
ncbi:MAG: LicD family protein, partial [Clostridia bacterium]|nr:LicD family protein [Clostridia bacterium]